ncbi:MdtA/MuxA family multidrug efflux RND transporter periplasmic adaptor subunit [Methylobacter sp. S3L5C]|uniref:MdtA/MuxA family multidrug efflux RND transporter periplasmic adaptor subunit n=1 Tax=Methylobacter sp. S3L5C TaxID=2839024 RepID=UPI001FAD623C|nr:MdtA/MuxA family multidrug efflux RND transporter periplasmic adaptor subunit [Methylobacter sp. S3L5C]UOA08391.1 MdtA/MuxA family multidrug efflux RND transporter periplasmic adaptor subunit [Methylobacter sp. S3L5C]
MIPAENKETTTGKFHWKTATAVILLIAIAAYLFSHAGTQPGNNDKKSGKFADPVVAVAAVKATQGDFPVYLNGLGTITALRTVTIRSRVDGELIRVTFKEGQIVKEGDLLAEIDPRAFQVQLMQVEGQLQRDEALLNNARIDLVRYKTLLEQDSIAAQQSVTQESVVKQYQGTVAIDRGLLADAKLQLSYTKITAPISGRLGLRLVDQGNMVKASDTNGLAVITQIHPIAVVFTLPEDNLPSVMKQFHSNNNSLAIEAYDRKGQIKLGQGQLFAVDNQIDINTGTVKLKGQFTNEDNAFFSNQFVNIKMDMGTLHSVTIIPTAAIQRGVMGTFAYVVKADQTVSIKPLKLGPIEGEKVAVLEGLQADELVVVDGADKLRENMLIKLITPEATAAVDQEPLLPDKKDHRNKNRKSGNDE